MALNRSRASRGFTLVELLMATALFAVLGLLMFQIARDAADIWNSGERNRVINQGADAAFTLLATDLRHLWAGAPGAYEQDARLVSSARRQGYGQPPDLSFRRSQGLAFTRLLHEHRELTWLRRAGDAAGGQATTSLLGEPDPLLLQPTSGLAESLFFTTILPGDELPSLMRCVRTPIGGPTTLTDPERWSDVGRLLADALPIAEDVLFFGVEFWVPGAAAWSREEWVEPTPDEGAAGAMKAGKVAPIFATATWDSTRGLSDDLPTYLGEDSLWDASDDATPALVRLTLVLAAGLPTGQVRETLGIEGRRLRLTDVRFLRDDEERPEFVLVDHEWMRILEEGVTSTEIVVERGARDTEIASHATGAVARIGRTFRRVVRLPTAREKVSR